MAFPNIMARPSLDTFERHHLQDHKITMALRGSGYELARYLAKRLVSPFGRKRLTIRRLQDQERTIDDIFEETACVIVKARKGH